MRNSIPIVTVVLVSLGLCCVLPGCSSGDEVKRYGLEGTVVVDGKPLSTGTIFLQPDSEQGNSGPGSAADIVNGKFSIPGVRGIVGGPYLATISGKMLEEPSNKQQVTAFDDHSIKITLPNEKSMQTFEVNSSQIPKSKVSTAILKGE